MKPKSFRIKLENPCKQNWDSMPEVQGGLYCKDCSKVIMDFTRMSDEELIRTLSQPRSGELCGKFYQNQLEKVYVLQEPSRARSYPGFRLFLAGLLTLRLSAEAQTPSAQRPPLIKTIQKPQGGNALNLQKTIKGKVFNRHTKAGIPAGIEIYASRTSRIPVATFYTDSTGNYKLTLPSSGLEKFFMLVYVSDNFEGRIIVADRDAPPAYLPVSLVPILNVEDVIQPQVETTGGVPMRIHYEQPEAIGGPLPIESVEKVKLPFPKRMWYKLKRLFRKP